MRSALALVLVCVAGCARDPAVALRPLPPLVTEQPQTTPLAADALLLPPGEQLIWEVYWKGLAIGRVELAITDDEVHSRFATGKLASSVTSIVHELATALDRPRALPRSQREITTENGAARTIDAAFNDTGVAITEAGATRTLAGARVHTLHSALGALRAWARLDAAPGVLNILVGGEPRRFEVQAPIAETLLDRDALRISARAQDHDATATVIIWLADDATRAPLRIEITSQDARVTAELISITRDGKS